MSDTPETDALTDGATGYPHPGDAVDLCRKMERRLRKAERLLDSAKHTLMDEYPECDHDMVGVTAITNFLNDHE